MEERPRDARWSLRDHAQVGPQTVAGLSGGQRQSVAVAKAVMWNSRVVILDEPTAAPRRRADAAGAEPRAAPGGARPGRGHRPTTSTTSSRSPTGITVLRLGRGCALDRDKTTQQEVVHVITAGTVDTGRAWRPRRSAHDRRDRAARVCPRGPG